MWLLYFCRAMIGSLSETLTPFVTSDFQSHSLMPVINVMTSILSAATYMPIAKILNIWDRTWGFSAMMVLSTLGLVLMAASKSFAVYTAANVREYGFLIDAGHHRFISAKNEKIK